MGFSMAVQWVGLVRGEGTPAEGRGSANRRANGGAILSEMMQERRCHADNFDPSRTALNTYEADRPTGQEIWADMVARANAYRAQVTGRDGTVRERSLRKDAVIGWSVIFNPPGEVTSRWTPEEEARFFRDCREVLGELAPVCRAANVRAVAVHRDEGDPELAERDMHMHMAGEMLDEDGRYCAKEQWNIRVFRRVNEGFPAAMRARGWDMDDLDLFDLGRAGDAGYRDERRRRRARQGLDADEQARRARRRKADQARAEARQAEEEARESRQEAAEATREAEAARRSAEAARGAQEAAEAARGRAEGRRDAALRDRDLIEGDGAYRERGQVHRGLAALRGERDSLEGQVRDLEARRDAARDEARRAAGERDAMRAERDAARRDRDALRASVRDLRAEESRLREAVAELTGRLAELRDGLRDVVGQVAARAFDLLCAWWRDFGPWAQERDWPMAREAVDRAAGEWDWPDDR